MKTYSTFLPVFTGFYSNDNFDINLDYEIEYIHEVRERSNLPTITGIELETDYNKFQIDISKSMCDYIESEFNSNSDTEISIKFDNLYSPKYYNFGNDSINCQITCDVIKLIQICSDNVTKFETYINERYTGYDGFIPSHSNDVSDWLDVDYIEERSEHRIGTLLEFICKELYDIYEPSLTELDICDSNYILNTEYWIAFNPFNNESIVCKNLENFDKACYWFRNYSGLEKTNFVADVQTLCIKFMDSGNEILKQIEVSNLIDFEYRLESIDSFELK